MEAGKRYKKVTTIQYVEDAKGQYLAMRGPGGNVGVMDLSVKTSMGLPMDPTTKKPYAEAGFAVNDLTVIK
jgi:hypothetical protein